MYISKVPVAKRSQRPGRACVRRCPQGPAGVWGSDNRLPHRPRQHCSFPTPPSPEARVTGGFACTPFVLAWDQGFGQVLVLVRASSCLGDRHCVLLWPFLRVQA